MKWQKLSRQAIKERVFKALEENRNYDSDDILGIPGTYLDTAQFYRDAEFLKEAPYLRTLINTPNHIGCHTLTRDAGEDLFRGTQKLEIELLDLVTEDLLHAPHGSTDGYVAPGGTEANIQALWIYRNYFKKTYQLRNEEVGVVFSTDSHYSFYKGCNLLSLYPIPVAVEDDTRQIDLPALRQKLAEAHQNGVKALILVANMSTTLFGSVDDLDRLLPEIKNTHCPYKVHVDAAFGGFIYPITNPDNPLDYRHPEINSITLDAHKMLMAPYGTGIFTVRKGWMHYAATEEAQYVQGLDYTICGSRNGAQAISIWMILQIHGPEGWRQNITQLMEETDALCQRLNALGLRYFRNPHMNIVSLRAGQIPESICRKYRLVADNFDAPRWWKIVVMPHTRGAVMQRFLRDVEEALG